MLQCLHTDVNKCTSEKYSAIADTPASRVAIWNALQLYIANVFYYDKLYF